MMSEDRLTLLFLLGMVLGGFLGFLIGTDCGISHCQKEAIAVGTGKYVKSDKETIKFEWVKPAEKEPSK